jgi:hypothetical protein
MLTVSVCKSDVQHFEVKLVGNVVLFNGMEGKKDYSQNFETKFDRRKNSFDVSILKGVTMRNEGYIYHGKIAVECNFLALRKANIFQRIDFEELS